MNSIFDVIGPVMVGPSSSHTAGAARLGKMARYILNDVPKKVEMTLFGSFAKTYKGHGTDKALVTGLLGFAADDERIPKALDIAEQRAVSFSFLTSPLDMGHPNVVTFNLWGEMGRHVIVTGRSLGGGRIMITSIDQVEVEITGETYTLLTIHSDKPGVIARVTDILGKKGINISGMRVFRKEKHVRAVMIIETDSIVEEESLCTIQSANGIEEVMAFRPL